MRHPSQHGVDEARVTRCPSVGLRKPDRQIDRRVIRDLKPENLRRTEQQDGFDPRSVGRKALVEKSAKQMPQSAEPPQHGCSEPAHQGAVAFGKSGKSRMCVLAREKFVECSSPPQNAVEDVGGNSSSGEAGNFRLRGSARTRHTRIVAEKLCPRRERSRKYRFNSQVQVVSRVRYSALRRSR